ncbi:MAG: prolyl oligopeptidase family serine peptidase [Bacteroidia bacterium]|nr:prolyl oligopeptidase family serine peptidase [Bacteroidia bacterium]
MKNSLLISVFMWVSFAALAQQEEFEKKVYISPENDTLRYRVLTPEKVAPNKKYPLVLFLHGAGERGNDNEAQLRHGGNMFTNPVNREKYPAFVIFPQCPQEDSWAPRNRSAAAGESAFNQNPPMTKALSLVKKVLDEAIEKYPVDEDRIYIAGLSMGGMGTFDMLCRYPHLFAAAIPICGGVSIERLGRIKTRTAIRIYHGDADTVVPVTYSREAYKTLKQNKAGVEYIEYPGINHDSWTPAFNENDFMAWIFSKRK